MTDRAVIDALTEAILAERAEALVPHFEPLGLRPPSFRWNPSDGNLFEAPLKVLHGWWKRQRPRGAIPSIDAVDPAALRDALGYLMILDVLDNGWDYRYRLYGTEIAKRAKRDYTGLRTSELKVVSPIPTFYIACYRAVLVRPQPLMTRNQAPSDVATTSWTRLVLPLRGPEDSIARFLVGNVPGEWREIAPER
jgi:hypothetical protein